MKLVNSKGRVLLEVHSATAQGIDARGLFGVLYAYRGDGCGGNTDIVNLNRTIEAIKLDNPSAKAVGHLPEPRLPDFSIANHGSIFLLQAHTDAAREWVDEHLPEDRQTWAGATVVEHRYIDAIACGITNDGLSIRGNA